MASTGHMANSTRFEARAKAGIELGWRAKRTTPIVSSLDLDLCSFFFETRDRSGRRERAHHVPSFRLRQVTARHKKIVANGRKSAHGMLSMMHVAVHLIG